MRRSLVSLFVGITLAAMAVFLVGQYKNSTSMAVPGGGDDGVVQVVVASQDLPFGTELIRDYLGYVAWPAASVPEGAFLEMEPLLQDEEGNPGGRVVIRALFKGEPLIKQKISGYGNKPTLSRKVAEDKRAFSIQVNATRGVSGFLLPGDNVDVMLTRQAASSSRGNDNLVTDVILQNVTILGIDQIIDEGAEKPLVAKTVTLEVDADQAQRLALAEQIGTLSLTLRNYSDSKEVSVGRVSVGDLSGAPASKTTEGGTVVRIRRGTEVDYARMP